MASNTNILPNLIEAVRAYVAGLTGISFAGSVVGQSDYRIADEERDGILGLHLPIPAVIVSCAQSSFDLLENPCIQADVTVTVRHSQEGDTYAQHLTEAGIVHDGLWDQVALAAAVEADAKLVLSDITYGSVGFQRSSRAYESTINFNVTVASVAT